jgi:serine protease Do
MRSPRPSSGLSPAALLPSSAAVLAVLAPFVWGALSGCSGAPPPPPPAPVVTVAPAPVAPPPPAALTPAQIAARATPAVVSITSPNSFGTGFVIRKDGWVATNLHVIAGASELTVVTADRHEYPVVEVLGFDELHDLALVRIEAKEMSVVSLGDSDLVRAGDSVVAIGHPLRLEDTVSNGLVSAVRVLNPAQSVLQISAPIAPGSSGGPLFSDKGEVIGVATFYGLKGQNLNFGVPVRYLKALLEDTHPVPLATFAEATREVTHDAPHDGPALPQIKRDVPSHDVKLLAGCSDGDLEHAARIVREAIEVGAPVYNQKHFAACYHIYEGAAVDVEKRLPATCPGPKKAMHDGRTKAQKLDDPSLQAWAMRDAFDGLIDVILRKVGPKLRH